MTTIANTATPNHASRPHMRVTYQGLVDIAFAVFIFAGAISFIEPSPYDFMALIAIPLWFVGGFKINRVQLVIILLWCVFEVAGFASLMPYWVESDARVYQFQSLYLIWTVICFTLFFGERTIERTEICLKAYTLGAFLSAFTSILSYFGVIGFEDKLINLEGRMAGTFKDPNVFGSYMTLAAAFVFQDLLIGKTKSRIFSFFILLTVLTGALLSYSRGSWGASILSLTLLSISTFVTAETKEQKRRVVFVGFIVAVVVVLVVLVILSQESIRDFFFQRAMLLHDYDQGATGRFGNQLHSIPMLLDRPNGFGPLRFRLFFGIEPHNSYIGGFANDGWIGGFAWISIVLASIYVGFRLIFVPSPYRRYAQVVWPVLFALLLQGFQIDIDHWRQLFLLFGLVWGLESARMRWAEHERRQRVRASQIQLSETYV